jgi:hypothetical protein
LNVRRSYINYTRTMRFGDSPAVIVLQETPVQALHSVNGRGRNLSKMRRTSAVVVIAFRQIRLPSSPEVSIQIHRLVSNTPSPSPTASHQLAYVVPLMTVVWHEHCLEQANANNKVHSTASLHIRDRPDPVLYLKCTSLYFRSSMQGCHVIRSRLVSPAEVLNTTIIKELQ